MPQEPLHIEDLTGSGAAHRVLRLRGPITISNLFEFQALIRGNMHRILIIDLTEVPYIDSAGIGALVGAYVNHQKDGRSLALAGVTDRVRSAMQVTHVEQFFIFHADLESAQKAVAKT
jgi:anti-sigma B factor antagonist